MVGIVIVVGIVVVVVIGNVIVIAIVIGNVIVIVIVISAASLRSIHQVEMWPRSNVW